MDVVDVLYVDFGGIVDDGGVGDLCYGVWVVYCFFGVCLIGDDEFVV